MRYSRLQNLSDLEFDLSRSLKVKCEGAIGLNLSVSLKVKSNGAVGLPI